MNNRRLLIDVPFKSMDWDGLRDDVDRELSELAKFYHDDYIDAFGKNTKLTDEDFYESVRDNFCREKAHRKLAEEMLSAIGDATREVLGVKLNVRFRALVPPDVDGGWRILGSVAASPLMSLTGETTPEPRVAHDRIVARLVESGCDEDTFFDEFFSVSEIYFGTSCGIDFEGFYSTVAEKARLIDGYSENIWRK